MEDLSVIVFPKLFTSLNVYSEIISSLYALLKRHRCCHSYWNRLLLVVHFWEEGVYRLIKNDSNFSKICNFWAEYLLLLFIGKDLHCLLMFCWMRFWIRWRRVVKIRKISRFRVIRQLP